MHVPKWVFIVIGVVIVLAGIMIYVIYEYAKQFGGG